MVNCRDLAIVFHSNQTQNGGASGLAIELTSVVT